MRQEETDKVEKLNFQAELQKLPAANRDETSRTGTAAAKARIKEPFKRMRFPTTLPPCDFSLEEAQSLCPPDSKIYNDTWNGRWTVAYKKIRGISRNWNLYGHRESALVCIRWAWDMWQRENVGAECPIADLLK